jgi:tetratricopeptide (TPR) repeat protein
MARQGRTAALAPSPSRRVATRDRTLERHLIALEVGDRRAEGRAYGRLGDVFHSLGEHQRAIEHYEQLLAIAREVGDSDGERLVCSDLGDAHEALGDDERASEYRAKADKMGSGGGRAELRRRYVIGVTPVTWAFQH